MSPTRPRERARACSTTTATIPSTTRTPAATLTRASRSPCTSETRSRPREFGSNAKTFTELLAEHPNVIAYVAGHTHEHALLPCGSTRTTGPNNRRFCGDHTWWEINTAAVADWPHQHRLIDVMDNRDDTLSIFGTVLDHASPATAPDARERLGLHRPPARGDRPDLRLQRSPERPAPGEGDPQLDQNVELVLDDPRQANMKITKTRRSRPGEGRPAS